MNRLWRGVLVGLGLEAAAVALVVVGWRLL